MKKIAILFILFCMTGCNSATPINSDENDVEETPPVVDNSVEVPQIDPTESTICSNNQETIVLHSSENQLLMIESSQTTTLEELELSEDEYADFVDQLEYIYNGLEGVLISIERLNSDSILIQFRFDLREVENAENYSFSETESLALDINIDSLTNLGYVCSTAD